MPTEKLTDYHLILASGSPRRQEFFKSLHLDFTVDVRKTDENYPSHLKGSEISEFIAKVKAKKFTDLKENDLLITSDTIVWLENEALGKPQNAEEAKVMLQRLSGKMHEVISSVCFTTKKKQKTISETTKVWFKHLSEKEIDFYVNTYKPFDKAGSYGIQEWIGFIGVERIEGSYFNVMGMPTHGVYRILTEEFTN